MLLASPFGDQPILVAGVGLLPHEFWLIVVGAGLALVVHVLLHHTLHGTAFRAISQSEEGARLLGINTFATITLAYVLSTILAFMAGVLIAPLLFRLSNGREYVIPHPNLVFVGRTSLNIGWTASDLQELDRYIEGEPVRVLNCD